MIMEDNFDRKLVLEDGTEVYGCGFGSRNTKVLELVFNTSMVGYQEILSDPSYTDQAVVMTYPLIGNYGMADDDYETKTPTIGAMICREYNPEPSNFRSTRSLGAVMEAYGIVGISGVDTRMITRLIRDKGSQKVCLADAQTPKEECLAMLASTPLPHDAVSRVSTPGIRESFVPDARFHVVAVDCGMKENILRSLNQRGCNVTVVPWNTGAEAIEALHPDGVLLSNGPGDPSAVPYAHECVGKLIHSLPTFGICFGHQVLAHAIGAHTYKLKFGHRGGNQPVKNLETGRVYITAQNHGFAADAKSVENAGGIITEINLNDDTVEGLRHKDLPLFSVQYHPEAAPGPNDADVLFREFYDMTKKVLGA